MSQGVSDNECLVIWNGLLQPTWNGGKKIPSVFPKELVEDIAHKLRRFPEQMGARSAILLLEEWIADNGLVLVKERELAAWKPTQPPPSSLPEGEGLSGDTLSTTTLKKAGE